MRKYLLLSLLTAVLSPLLTQAQNTFTINGKMSEKRHPQKAFLLYTLYGQQKQIIDSSEIKNGKFTFKGTVTDPVLATVKIKYQSDIGRNPTSAPETTMKDLQDGKINNTCSTCLFDAFGFMLAGGKLSLVAADSVKHATITGPKVSMDYSELGKNQESVGIAWVRLQKDQYEAKQLPRGSARTRALAIVADSLSYINGQICGNMEKFAQSHLDSYAGLYVFNDLLSPGVGMMFQYQVNSPVEYFKKFSPEVRASLLGQTLAIKFGLAKPAESGKP